MIMVMMNMLATQRAFVYHINTDAQMATLQNVLNFFAQLCQYQVLDSKISYERHFKLL